MGFLKRYDGNNNPSQNVYRDFNGLSVDILSSENNGWITSVNDLK